MSESENPSSEDKITFLGRQYTRAQMEPYIKFYEADRYLNKQDRKVMASELNWITTSAQLWGMFDASLAFFVPTAYRRFTTAKRTQVVETWRNMPVRQFIHRPFVSMAIGTVTYFLSLVYHAKTLLDYQVALTTKEIAEDSHLEESEGKKRRLNVWKSMSPSQVSLYYLYYLRSSEEPALALKDPRELAANPHEVVYIPPRENSRSRAEPEREEPHWANIRAANGFSKTSQTLERENDADSLDPFSEPETESPDTPTSAWDKIRRGN